jgi:hypothetical protein
VVQPLYVGWVHVWPESNEKYTPETPTPVARSRHVPSLTASGLGQACSSTKSFDPATKMFGEFASIATAGSF